MSEQDRMASRELSPAFSGVREPITRWPKLWALLTGKPLLTPAQRRWQEVKARADDRYEHGDDRGYGRACMELEQIQRERLRLGQ